MDDFAAHLDRWKLTRDPVAGAASPLSLAVHVDGAPATLRLLTGDSDEASAARALRHLGGHGAVRVLREDRRAVLLQRAVPGTALATVVADGRDDEATEVLAGLMLRLHHGRRPPAGWTRAADLGAVFDRHRAHGSHRHVPHRLVERGESAWRTLNATPGRQFLLHGDLHHDNVVRDAREGWLAVEPRALVGETACETAAALRGPTGLYPFQLDRALMRRRVAIFAERLSLDRTRILGWHLAGAVLAVLRLAEQHAGEAALVRAVRVAEAAAIMVDAG